MKLSSCGSERDLFRAMVICGVFVCSCIYWWCNYKCKDKDEVFEDEVLGLRFFMRSNA